MSGFVGVAIVGTGFAGHIHARCYGRMPDLGVRVVATVSAMRSQAEAFAREHGIPYFYDDLRWVLDRSDVQIVDLCVPNHLHKPMAVEAAQAGKHVICEKPLTGYFGEGQTQVGATSRRTMLKGALSNATEMFEAANRHGVRLMYAENWVYSPVVRKMEELIAASGGTILEIRAQEAHSGSHSRYAKEWRYSGGGALARLGCHPIGAGLYLKMKEGLGTQGRPVEMEALWAEVGNLSQTIPPQHQTLGLVTDWVDVENWATVVIAFADGSRGVFSASDICLGGMADRLEVLLSNGHLQADLTHSTLLRAYAPDQMVFAQAYVQEKLETKAGWSHPSVDEEWMLGYPQELRDFVEAVVEERAPLVDPRLGYEVLRAIYAAYLSAETGQRVRLPGLEASLEPGGASIG